MRPGQGKVKELAETGLYDRLSSDALKAREFLYLQHDIDQAAVRLVLLATVLMTTALVLRSRVRRKHVLSLSKGLKHGSEAAVGEVIPPLTVP